MCRHGRTGALRAVPAKKKRSAFREGISRYGAGLSFKGGAGIGGARTVPCHGCAGRMPRLPGIRACLVTGYFRLRMGDHAEPVLFVVRGPALCCSGPPCICGPDVTDGHELRRHGHDRSGQHGGHGRRGGGRFHLESSFPAGHRLPAFPAGHERPSGGRRAAFAHPAPATAGHLAHAGHQRHPDDRLLRHLLAFAVLRAG